ncbi:hypothetical protein T439DRAFT_341384 [Meredithblackwellia eburnea MCA 4105]
MSLFKRKNSKTTLEADLTALGINNSPGDSPPLPSKSGLTQNQNLRIDDFGREVARPAPAFGVASANGSSAPFGSGYGVGDEDASELVLMYGYSPIATTLELRPALVAELVHRCALELKERGLVTPLVLSTMSLDISVEETSSLIRSYLTNDPPTFAYDLHLAAPLAVGAFLKWGLARLVNDKGGRGFLSWDAYESWKVGEKATSYPARYCSENLIGRLPNTSASLLSNLLTLFSSISAYSSKNGLTPRKLAGLFSAYVFGISDDKPFDETYIEWQRATDAFEHIILAFIRDQQATSGRIPTHLEQFIIGYPSILNVSYAPGAHPKVPKGGRVEEVTRVRRLTRFHSRNLIRSAGTWDVPYSPDWKLFFPTSTVPNGDSTLSVSTKSSPNAAKGPSTSFTPHYRHLLNIRSNSQFEDDDDEGELQRYKSVVEKEWGSFCGVGFNDIDSGKLQFDLTESERSIIKAKHDTLDWFTFESSGFGGRETFAPEDLIFHQNIAARVQQWPASQQAINERLRETERMLPPFPYDTTPHEEGRILVDINFFEAWADVLVSGGWARDELKESSFALVQWKSRPRDGELPKGRVTDGDDRTEERWVLIEEFVPKEYRDELREGKHQQPKKSKRASFLRSVRKKTSTKEPPRLNVRQITHPEMNLPVSPPASSPYHSIGPPRKIDESVFAPGNGGDTKIMSLSNVHLGRNGGTDYAPSFISTVNAGHGHSHPDSIAESPEDDFAPTRSASTSGPFMGNGVGGTLSSQRRGSAFGSMAAVGYTKPSTSKGFLARIATRKNKNAGAAPYSGAIAVPASPTSPESPYQGNPSLESYGMPSEQDSNSTIRGASSDRERPPLPSVASSGSLGPPPPPPPKTMPGIKEPDHQEQSPEQGYYSPQQGNSPQIPQNSNGGGDRNGFVYEDGDPSYRDTQYSVTSSAETGTTETEEDPYDGIESDESVKEGTVLFRGSRTYSMDAGRRALIPVNPDGSLATQLPPQMIRPLPVPNGHVRPLPTPGGAVRPPDRHESLPPSPKPDADVPVDDEIRQRDKFASGASGYSQTSQVPSRVSNMIGIYETRDRDVRLTNYGFGERPPSHLP